MSGQSGSPGGGQGLEGGGEAEVADPDLFEEMCASRCPDPELEDIWGDKEKQITFTHQPRSVSKVIFIGLFYSR